MDVSNKRGEMLLIVVFLLFYVIVVLRNAWTCDDAYISFRVVDNFVNGYGLRWNIAERVQAYTNPLWVFVLSPVYMITRNMYFTAIGVSVLMSTAAVALLAFKVARGYIIACVGILGLILSNAFIDYSTSGLENPLSFLLLALFLIFYLKQENSEEKILYISIIASLAAVNRLDTILLYLPAIIYMFWQFRNKKALLNIMIGFSPLIIWEVFSIIYYGFPFPNTAYAKLNTGISVSIMSKQGFCYFANSLNVDPITIFIIGLGLIIPLVTRDKKHAMLMLGLFLYLLYIVRIGGCFMAGRHFAIPIFLATSIIMISFAHFKLVFIGILAGISLLLGLTSDYSPIFTRYNQGYNDKSVSFPNSITDERKFYFQSSGLINYNRNSQYWPNHGWVYEGLGVKAERKKVYVAACIGFLGFNAGPEVHIIDLNALADPLLASVPTYNRYKPSIGHFARNAPGGYQESIMTGENLLSDSSLAKYYNKLKCLIMEDIWSFERFKEIYKMNMGVYDYLIDEYINADIVHFDFSAVNSIKEEGLVWNAPGNIVIQNTAIEIDFPAVQNKQCIEVSRDNNDEYIFEFLIESSCIYTHILSPDGRRMEGLAIAQIEVPAHVANKGFDAIRISPGIGDGMHSIGHIRFIENE
ncbi:MAG: hypothetical protein V3V99_13140 [candidate division Zixibacteria bacterium]